MTDFDKAAEQVAGGESDPFDVAAGGVLDDGRKALRSSLYTSLMANPDMAARSQKLGRKVGLPADVVERNLPEVERNAQLNEFDKLLDNSPVVATWLADPNNAKIAHDDVDSLAGIEKVLRSTALNMLGATGNLLMDSGRSPKDLLNDSLVTGGKAAVGLPNMVVGLADIASGGNAGKALDSVGFRFNEANKILDSMYSPAQQAANREVQQADGFVNTTVAAINNPSVIVTTIAESLPQMGAGGRIGRFLLGVGGKVLAPGVAGPALPGTLTRLLGAKSAPVVAGSIGEGLTGAGSAAEQIRAQTADGLLTPKQSLSALGSGAGTGILNFLGGKLSQRFGIDDIDTAIVRGDIDGAALEATQKGFLRKITEAGFSEGVFEEMGQSAQEQMWQNFANDRPIMDGVGNASAMGILSGTTTGGTFAGIQHTAERRAQAAQAAEQSSAQLEKLSKFAAASKLLERDPDTFEQFVAQATADGPVQDVFIDANTLMQSGVAYQLAILSPSVAAQLEEAAATGGNIRIPVSEYAARIAASDYGAGLLEHLKTDPEGMSRAEAQEYHQSEIKELEAQVEQALTGRQDVDEFKASQQRVKEAILGELNQLGRFTSQKNEVDATIAASRMAVRAAQLGKTPEQFFQDEALRFNADKVTDTAQQFDRPQEGQSEGARPLDSVKKGSNENGEFYVLNTEGVGEWRFSNSTSGSYMEFRSEDDPGKKRTYILNMEGDWVPASQIIRNVFDPSANAFVGTPEQRDIIGRLSAVAKDINTPLEISKKAADAIRGIVSGEISVDDATSMFTGSSNTFDQQQPEQTDTQQFDQAEQARNYSEFDQQVQSDMFSGEFADETTTLKREVVVSSNGTTAIVEMPNVDSTGRRITGTTQGLENFWNFYGNGPVDDQGRPVLLYHSTNSDITRFETGRETTNNYGILGDVKTSRAGIFATPDSDFSQEYLREGSGQNVMPIYMGLQNPLDLRQGVTEEIESALEAAGISANYVHNIQNQWELFDNDDSGRNEFVEKLQAAGYDGAIIVEDSPGGESQGGDTYVAFDPTQIKSAIGNTGVYSKNDPNIYNQDGKLQTDTPEFRKWFGDSKVVDESGKPLVVYHGTNQDIEQFNTDGGKGKTFGTGAFFSSNPATANTYTGGINGGNVMPVYLTLKNPAVFDANGANWSRLGKDVKVSLPSVEVSAQADEDLLAELMDTQPKKGVTKKLKARNTTLGKLFPDDFLHEDHFSTDDLARWAKKKGYDGVIIKNVVDHGPTGAMSTPEARDPSNIYVAFNKTAIKSAIGNNGDFNPNDPSIYNQAAYHGSPYKFSKFSLDHMGKGEGAQAYGWGLYFAGSKQVAEYYRETLAIGKGGNNFRQMAVDALAAEGVTLEDDSALTVFQKFAMEMTDKGGKPASYARKVQNASAPMRAYDTAAIGRALQTYVEAENKGQLYKVEIPEDDTYLLWDKPLSEQPAAIRDAIGENKPGGEINPDGLDMGGGVILDNRNGQADPNQVQPWVLKSGSSMFGLSQKDVDRMVSEQSDPTGENIYTRLAAEKGSQEAASKYLHSLGINGIKYLDGVSRGAGEGNYNYVIFDDAAVNIVETYYQDGPKPQAATNLPKPPDEVQVLDDLPDEVAEDVVTLFKDLGSDDDAFRLPRGASDDLVETILSALPKDTYAETDFAALEAFQDEAAKRGDPDVLDVKRFDMKVRIKGKPGVMQEKSGFVFTNAAGEVWVDLSDMKEAPGLGANFYTRVRDWADRVGATFVGDPEGLSDDALLKRTEHMASAIARSKSARSVKAHVRQMDPYNDPIYKTSPLNKYILPLPWLADAKLNERNLIKASWRNIATVMPELKHATIDLRNGQILLENAPITSSFDDFVSGLRQGNVALRGGSVGDSTGGQVQQDPALRKARELYGSASVKRFLLANTAAQYSGQSERGLVLARLGELYPVLESLDNQKVFYQTNGKKAQDGESDLIVTHNLSADNLLHAKKMGGIPVPSLAVTKKGNPLDGFGEITLIAPKDMADPQGYAGAKVFGADIYSPRYPSVEYIIPNKTITKVSREITPAENATGERLDFDEIRRGGTRAFEHSAPMMWRFLTDRGYAPDIVMNKPGELSAALLPFADDTRHAHELRDDPAFIEAAWQARRELLVKLYQGDESAADDEIAADRVKDNAYRIVQSYARDIERYQREMRDAGKPDAYETKRAMEQQIEQLGLLEDFKASNRDFLESMAPEEKIFQGFTYSGNRKYVAHTLDNVVKILKKELRGGENFNYGVGSLRAKFTPQFKSLAQIRKEKGRLLDSATFKQVKDEIDSEFFRVAELIESGIRLETAISIMEDAAKVGVKRAAKTYSIDISDDAAVEVAEFLTKLRNLPTEYFEVKILRDVDLAEFAGAVVPEGVDPKVIQALRDRGVKDIRTYRKGDEADRAARIGEFEHLFFQRKNGPRGGYNPALNTISLFKGADLSTFLHELGHYFLESDIKIVSDLVNKPELTAGEAQIVKDVSTLLNWFGITGPIEEQLAVWYSLDFEEKRRYHEKAAESFERYLFEGKAPSIELQPYFQTIRSWMTDVYQSIKNFLARNPDAGQLTDEVRGVFDRMLASDEQIALAEHGRSMMPLFASPDQAGMTPDEFAAYQALGKEATGEAVQDMQARAARDMQWLNNSRGREIRKLKKLSKARRAEVRMEVTSEVMSQQVYRAWSFLTRKMTAEDKPVIEKPPKSGPGPLDPTVDSLFVAIAKNGGLQKDEVISTWGIDPADKPQSGIFGKPVWRREGGLTIDEMAEALQQDNYIPLDQAGKWDVTDLEELFKSELRGNPQYSTDYAYWGYQEPRPGEGVTEDNVGAGRLDEAEVRMLGLPDDVTGRVKGLRMTAKDGIHPDIVAEMFGFTSGDELVRALADATPPKQEIEGLTDARLLENYGELATPEAIERAADKAIHNEARARFVATEVNALAKATGQRRILASAARELASVMIARLKVRDIRPGQYASAEVRAAKAAVTAMKGGNLTLAAVEKRNQLINNYATRAAYDAQDDVEKGVRYLKKFESEGTRKNLDADYTDQIDALLERFDLRKQSLKAIDKRKALADWITSQREQGLEPEIPAQLENEAFRKSYKEMTVEEFRGLVDTIKQIEHLGRLKNKLLTAADNRTFNEAKERIAASIEEHSRGRTADTRTPTTNLGRAAQGLRRFWASHIKAATWARVMDGGIDGGPMWEYFIRSANESGDRETTMRAEATIELSKIMAPVFKLGKMGGKGKFFPTIGRSLNREARIAIALNTGNEGNLQRLLGGEGWNLPQLMPVLQSMTAEEWQAVQAVWDHFESYRPMIAAKERRVYGREPSWIEAKPFTVTTADGQEVSLRGGYYPIKYDPAASQRAEEHADAEGAKRQLQGAYTSATTRRSFTKTRVEEVKGRPLLYTLAGVYSGVNDVIHDLTWHEWLIDTNRLLRSNTIDNAIRSHYGPEAKAQLKSWAADIAEGDKMADNAGEVALGRLRQGISAAGLGFNAMSAAMQVLGFTQSIVRVGPTWVGRGIQQYLANPRAVSRRVNEMSDFMANRSRTRFRELNELRNKVQDETEVGAAIKGGTFFLMMRAQQMVDVPTWLGAYEKAIADGNDDERAIALADQALIDAQGGGQTKDLSAIERGGPALKLFTVFYSFMNTAYNLGVGQTMTSKGKAKLAADYALLYVIPPILGSMLKAALTPGGGDDEDEDMEALARKLAAEQLSYLMGMMVIVREFSGAAKLVTGAEGVRGYEGPAGLRFIPDVTRFVNQAGQGEFDDAFRKSAINVIGDFTGLPSAQVNRTITGAKALNEGETSNPAALVFGFQK